MDVAFSMDMERENQSIWQATLNLPQPTFPELTETRKADVVIIGGGISGLTAAFLLTRAGKNVTLLESYTIGSGATGHSTGNLYATVDYTLNKLQKKWGKEIVARVVSSRAQALNFIESTIDLLKIDCNFKRVPFYYFTESHQPDAESFLKEEFKASQNAGLNPELLPSAPLPFPTLGALKIPHQAQFHPLRYLYGIAKELEGKCHIYEHSPVIEIDSKKGIVRTNRGSIQAEVIISATHTPKGVFPVQLRMSPIREHGVAVACQGEFPRGIFWRADGPHSIRSLTMNGKKHVMVIGKAYKTGQNPKNKEEVNALEQYLKDHAPVEGSTLSWAAQSFESSDALPFIGKQNDRLYFSTAFSADGLVYGTLGAQLIADQILGRENSWQDLYTLKRFTPVKSAKAMLKEGANNFVQYLKDLPKVGTKKLEEIGYDDGGIVEYGGEKIAIYRDPQGRKHCVSAICPHLKGVVAFNPEERTWDCPCHASRFKITGEVIEGPALKGLERKNLS